MAFKFYDPKKWKLVPLTPTPEMIDNVLDHRMQALIKGEEHNLLHIYRDMVEAAPDKGFLE